MKGLDKLEQACWSDPTWSHTEELTKLWCQRGDSTPGRAHCHVFAWRLMYGRGILILLCPRGYKLDDLKTVSEKRAWLNIKKSFLLLGTVSLNGSSQYHELCHHGCPFKRSDDHVHRKTLDGVWSEAANSIEASLNISSNDPSDLTLPLWSPILKGRPSFLHILRGNK